MSPALFTPWVKWKAKQITYDRPIHTRNKMKSTANWRWQVCSCQDWNKKQHSSYSHAKYNPSETTSCVYLDIWAWGCQTEPVTFLNTFLFLHSKPTNLHSAYRIKVILQWLCISSKHVRLIRQSDILQANYL